MSETNSIIERVRKLLALSKSDNINEANIALRKANELIDTHRISEADLTGAEEIVSDQTPIYTTSRVTAWRHNLVHVITKHYGCAFYIRKGYRSSEYMLFGRKSDMEVVRYMFGWLSAMAEQLSQAEKNRQGSLIVDSQHFNTSYCTGFVHGVRDQFIKAREEMARIAATSTALVKLDSRSNEADATMKSKMFLKTVNTASKARINGDAYSNGKAKGASIRLTSALNSGK